MTVSTLPNEIDPQQKYLLRTRGKKPRQISGRMIIQSARNRSIGRYDELSEDGNTWVKAGDVSSLFSKQTERQIRRRKPIPSGATVEQDSLPQSDSEQSEFAEQSDTPTGTNATIQSPEQWFIAREGVSAGPYTHGQVVQWVSQQRLRKSDHVLWANNNEWVSVHDAQQRSLLPSDEQADTRSNGKTLAAMSVVLSFLGFSLLPVLGWYLGVICGHMALDRIGRSRRAQGRRAAYCGLSIGYVAICISIIVVFLLCVATLLRPKTETRFWYWYSERQEVREETRVIPIAP